MAGDDEVPVGGRTMQVDAVADALDVLDDEANSIAPPALPPPLPPKRRKFPIIAALVVGVVAIDTALLVGRLFEPDVPSPAATVAPVAEPTDAEEAPSNGTRIELGPITIQASHDASAGDEAEVDDAP